MAGEAFSVLSSIQRRRVLMALLEHNPQADSRIAIPEDVHMGESELEAFQLQMHHVHLPKLEEAGFIRWNQDEHEVVKGPRFDEIRPLLELLADHADELPDDLV